MAIFKKPHKRSGVTWYYIRFEGPDGKRRALKAGTTRDQARALLTKTLGEIAAGTWVDPRDVGKEHGPTFEEFADRFLKEYVAGRCRSEYYLQQLRPADPKKGKPAGPVRRYFEGKRFRAVNAEALERFMLRSALEDGAGPSTVRKRLTILGTMFKAAERWGVVTENPARRIVKPTEPRHKVRFLTADEWKRLHEAAPVWLRPLLRLAIATGMRMKEITSLQWGDVDTTAKLLHVAEDTKTGMRVVPLGGEAIAVLEAQREHRKAIAKEGGPLSPYVFTGADGKPFLTREDRNRITKATVSTAKNAGVAEASFHTLRHTAAAWMVQAGVSLYEVQRILGHSTPVMTQRYAHLQPDHLRGAVGKLDAALRGEKANPPATQENGADRATNPDAATGTLDATSSNQGG
jgi:integrase